MTHLLFLVLAFVLVGCGGEAFSEELFTQTGVGGSETGGATVGTGGEDPGTGGAQETGGTSGETGGSTSTGGTPETGGAASTGGATSTGGSTGCTLVTHSNGLGQTWQDCEPLGMYTQAQAMKACTASGATTCYVRAKCGVTTDTVEGHGTQIIAQWGFDGLGTGFVSPGDGQGALLGALCLGSGDVYNSTWD
jgi:hypothetical protein